MPRRVGSGTSQYLRDPHVWEPNRGGSSGFWSIQIFHWRFLLHRCGEGWLSSIGLEVSCRKPHSSSTVAWKAGQILSWVQKRPNSSLISGCKWSLSPSLLHLHCCGLGAVDSRRLPKFLNAQQLVCWCFQALSKGAQYFACSQVSPLAISSGRTACRKWLDLNCNPWTVGIGIPPPEGK